LLLFLRTQCHSNTHTFSLSLSLTQHKLHKESGLITTEVTGPKRSILAKIGIRL
jgi:hypothetical protein